MTGEADGGWTGLFGAHLDAAYRLARWLTGSGAEAEEVVQEACLRSWRALARSPRPANPRAFLLAVVRNAALTRLRGAARREKVVAFEAAVRELDRAAVPPAGEAAVAARQRALMLRRSLAALPVHHREVVVLRDIEDLAYAEIAAVLGLPVGTVMSRLARGRRRLRDLLAQEGFDARDAG